MQTEFSGLELYCKEDQFLTLPPPEGSPPGTLPKQVCRFTTGEEVLDSYNFNAELTTVNNIAILFGLAFMFSFFAYLFLLKLAVKKSYASSA